MSEYLRKNENNIFFINELSKKNEIKGFFEFEDKKYRDLLILQLSFLEGKRDNFEFLEAINFLQSNLRNFDDFLYLTEDFKIGFSGPLKEEDVYSYWSNYSNRLPKEPYFLFFEDKSEDICPFEDGIRLSRQCLFTQKKFEEIMKINNSIFFKDNNKNYENYIDKNLLSKGVLLEEKNNTFIEIRSFLKLNKIYKLNDRYLTFLFLKGLNIKKSYLPDQLVLKILNFLY